MLWLLADNLGTVRDLAKNDATLGEHYEYDSFGDSPVFSSAAAADLYEASATIASGEGTLADVMTIHNALAPSEVQDFVQMVADVATVWGNTSHMNFGERIYVTVGTAVASEVGVRQIDDAFHTNDAVDGHVQSTEERISDGVSGAIMLAATAIGARGKAKLDIELPLPPRRPRTSLPVETPSVPRCPWTELCFVAGTQVLAPAIDAPKTSGDEEESAFDFTSLATAGTCALATAAGLHIHLESIAADGREILENSHAYLW